jgi:hypothetical protein
MLKHNICWNIIYAEDITNKYESKQEELIVYEIQLESIKT